MRIRYTAVSELNTAVTARSVYDFGGAAGYFVTTGTPVNTSSSFELEFSFYLNSLSATATEILSINNFGILYAQPAGYLRFWRLTDSAGDNLTTLTIDAQVEQTVSIIYDGSGGVSVSLNTRNAESVVFTSTPTGSQNIRFGDSFAIIRPFDGFVFDARLYNSSNTLTNYWPCDDGSGTSFADSVGSSTASLTATGSPLPDGWESYTGTHYANRVYTKTINLTEYDRDRTPEKVVARSLSGIQRTTGLRNDIFYALKTVPLSGNDKRDMREFAASVDGGAVFEFDDGSAEDDSNFVQVVLEGSVTESRAVKRGGGGDSDYFTYSWRHREV